MQKHTVQPDAKGRITLGALAKGVDNFLLTQEKDGTITLEPMVSIPARELWLFKNPKALASVKRGLEDVAAGRVTRRGSFKKYLDVNIDS